ncbi:MAG: hypothetical protein ACR2MB_05890 [Acidimicrobiales bacterium]
MASFALVRLVAVQTPILHLHRHKEVGYAISAPQAEMVLVPGEWNGFDYCAMVHALVADSDLNPTVVGVAEPEQPVMGLGASHEECDRLCHDLRFTQGV